MKQSGKIAFCGAVAALGTVLMLLQGMVPVASIAIPALAGCFLIPVVVEAGVPWAFGTYGVTAVLAMLVAPDREAALIYLLFFGYYPALYAVLGRIRRKPPRYVAKFAVFNAACIAEALLSLYALGIPLESVAFLGRYTPVVLLVLANIVFFVYDLALDGLIAAYLRRGHPQVSKILKGK